MTGQLMVHAHKAPPEWENQRPSTLSLKGSMQRIKRVFCPLRQLLSLHLASVRITGSEDGLAIGSRINVVRVGGCATGTDKCNNSTECSPRDSSNGYRLLGPWGATWCALFVNIFRHNVPVAWTMRRCRNACHSIVYAFELRQSRRDRDPLRNNCASNPIPGPMGGRSTLHGPFREPTVYTPQTTVLRLNNPLKFEHIAVAEGPSLHICSDTFYLRIPKR